MSARRKSKHDCISACVQKKITQRVVAYLCYSMRRRLTLQSKHCRCQASSCPRSCRQDHHCRKRYTEYDQWCAIPLHLHNSPCRCSHQRRLKNRDWTLQVLTVPTACCMYSVSIGDVLAKQLNQKAYAVDECAGWGQQQKCKAAIPRVWTGLACAILQGTNTCFELVGSLLLPVLDQV